MKKNGINRTVTIPTRIQILGTCDLMRGMRRELCVERAARATRLGEVRASSRRLLQAQVAGAVLPDAMLPTMKFYELP